MDEISDVLRARHVSLGSLPYLSTLPTSLDLDLDLDLVCATYINIHDLVCVYLVSLSREDCALY